MDLIFTDLDGTLLDSDTYAWEEAQPALDRLKRRAIPWILVTSKTRAEVEFWRRQLGNDHPFVVENGGAAYVPGGYFSGGGRRDSYETLEWGTPYDQLVTHLQTASRISGCRVHGFHEMTPEEVASICDLPLQQAALAKQREWDEPFLVLDPDRSGALVAAIEALGMHWTRGGRFWHILGDNDKALAVSALCALFERANGPVRTVGMGDGLNDESFLNAVTMPVLVRSPQAAELKARIPHALLTERAGPAGWSDAVLAIIHDS